MMEYILYSVGMLSIIGISRYLIEKYDFYSILKKESNKIVNKELSEKELVYLSSKLDEFNKYLFIKIDNVKYHTDTDKIWYFDNKNIVYIDSKQFENIIVNSYVENKDKEFESYYLKMKSESDLKIKTHFELQNHINYIKEFENESNKLK